MATSARRACILVVVAGLLAGCGGISESTSGTPSVLPDVALAVSTSGLGTGPPPLQIPGFVTAWHQPLKLLSPAIALADVDGDGRPDFVTLNANAAPARLQVFHGLGDGTFDTASPMIDLAVGGQPTFVLATDLNGDGRPDVAVADGDPHHPRVLIFLNRGGTLPAAPDQVLTGFSGAPTGLAAGDVNGDGQADLAVVAGSDVRLFPSQGATGWSTPGTVLYSSPSAPPVCALIGPLFGRPSARDVVVVAGSGLASLYRNDGRGGFPATPTAQAAVAPNPVGAALADVDGDGVPDLIVGGSDPALTSSLSIAYGPDLVDAHGATGSERVALAGPCFSVAAGDVDGDGRSEVVAEVPGGSAVVAGSSDRGQHALAFYRVGGGEASLPYGAGRVAMADLDGDGHADVAALVGGDLETALGSPQGGLECPLLFLYSQPPANLPLKVAALGATLLEADANGLASSSVSDWSGYGGDPGNPFFALADLDGDGVLDTVGVAEQIQTARGSRDGTFARFPAAPSPVPLMVGGSGPYYAIGLAVADVNGDGRPDLVVPARLGAQSAVLLYLGQGDGTFQAPQVIDSPSGPVAAVAVGDLNRDGHPDLVAAVANAANPSLQLAVLLNRGSRTRPFAATLNPTLAKSGPVPSQIRLADLRRSGILDIVTANTGTISDVGAIANVSVLAGNGDGTFRPAASMAAGQMPRDIQAVDVNGDGIPDLIVANAYSEDVSVLPGRGDGTFAGAVTVPLNATVTAVGAVDYTGDGRLDLVVGGPLGVYVVRQR